MTQNTLQWASASKTPRTMTWPESFAAGSPCGAGWGKRGTFREPKYLSGIVAADNFNPNKLCRNIMPYSDLRNAEKARLTKFAATLQLAVLIEYCIPVTGRNHGGAVEKLISATLANTGADHEAKTPKLS